MNGNVYLLSTRTNRLSADVIYARDSSLKVRVYNLSDVNFMADEDEIQLFGYYNNDLLAFETMAIAPEDAMEMIKAIRWYATYLDEPNMEILPDDPRQAHENDIAV